MTENMQRLIQEDLTVRLMKIITGAKHVEAIQQQIDNAVKDYATIVRDDLDQVVSRRNALCSIVLLPVEACALVTLSRAKKDSDDLLRQCMAGLAACWHFSTGKERALASEAVSVYIHALMVIFQQSERSKATVAALLAQSFILKAELSRDVENIDQSAAHSQFAIHYAEMSNDVMLEALSWRTLAATHYHAGPTQYTYCFKAAEKSMKLMKLAPKGSIPLGAQSFIDAGASIYLATRGSITQAEDARKAAHRTYEAQKDGDSHWAAHRYDNIISCDTMSYFHVGDFKQAADSAKSLLALPAYSATADAEYHFNAIRVEVFRDDQPRRLDFCIEQWKAGLTKARELHSLQRLAEANQTYALIRSAWPQEQSIKDLQSLLVTQ